MTSHNLVQFFILLPRRHAFYYYLLLYTIATKSLTPPIVTSFIDDPICQIIFLTLQDVIFSPTVECPVCEVMFNKQRLLRHLGRVHTAEEFQTCHLCDKICHSRDILRSHQSQIHDIKG